MARLMLMAVTLVSFSVLADEPAKKRADERPQIYVFDDVGVGDHFPSQVPGSGPYRLPPKDEVAPPPPAPAAPAPAPVATPAPAPVAAPAPAVEQIASHPCDWRPLP